MTREYETLFVLHPELSEAEVREAIERTRSTIEGMGGSVVQVDEWGIRELAYPIRKQLRGYYVVVQYTGDGKLVEEIDRTMKISDRVLRHLTVRRNTKGSRAISGGHRPEAEERPATSG
ncbi:MAG: 30S ribosomal protein S6 [Candidatus Binatia bacterium]|nr:MAG: 30S ribosomal protein S6 [Candidatus Binatia bacterium]